MQKPVWFLFALVLATAPALCAAQCPKPDLTKPLRPAVYHDGDGNIISNNEFVDIRMANYHLPDTVIIRVLEDGLCEMNLQKVPQEGTEAPNFTAKYLDNSLVQLDHFRGKVLVLNFWFIGCPACMNEIPRLNELALKFAKEPDVVFLAMTADKAEDVKRFLTKNKFGYRMGVDAAEGLEMFGFGESYPKSIVIGRDGRIRYWRSTIHAWNKFESVIKEELRKTSSESR
jgi:peroxiredoxin